MSVVITTGPSYGGGAPTAEWEFRAMSCTRAPQADASYFPAVLVGRISPPELVQQIAAMNYLVAQRFRPIMVRRMLMLALFPVATIMFIVYGLTSASNVAHGGTPAFGLLYAAIGIMVSAVVISMTIACRARQVAEGIVAELRGMASRASAQYAATGLLWSIHLDQTLTATRRNRMAVATMIKLRIEVMQPGMYVVQGGAPGSTTTVVMGGGAGGGVPTAVMMPQGGYQQGGYQQAATAGYAAMPGGGYQPPMGYPQQAPPPPGYYPAPMAGGAQMYTPGAPAHYAAPAPGGNPAVSEFSKQSANAVGGGDAAYVVASAPGGADQDPAPPGGYYQRV